MFSLFLYCFSVSTWLRGRYTFLDPAERDLEPRLLWVSDHGRDNADIDGNGDAIDEVGEVKDLVYLGGLKLRSWSVLGSWPPVKFTLGENLSKLRISKGSRQLGGSEDNDVDKFAVRLAHH